MSLAVPARAGGTAASAIDPVRWPDVASVPRHPIRALIARILFTRVCARLPLRVDQNGRPPLGEGLPGSPLMTVHRPADFYQRIGASGLIGLGESYMAGDWDSSDLAGLFTPFAGTVGTLIPSRLQRLRRLAVRQVPATDESTIAGARRNIARHYDLSNDLFALFLDQTMTYSAALFEECAPGSPVPPPASSRQPGASASAATNAFLAAAQRRKIDRLLDGAGVGPGCRVLEVGTGWGELAIRAGQRGAVVRTATISAQQHALASQRIEAAGLSDRVRVDLIDYRELSGQYDVILSVEMIEAVGEANWPAYFAVLARLLAPGGTIGLQSITMPHERMLATRKTQTWVLKYIFPGGLIPSQRAIETHATAAGLSVTGRHEFGQHYAQTLRIWRERFAAAEPDLGPLGFDAVFRRMWTLYLAYSEAGFQTGYLDVCQLLLTSTRTNQALSSRHCGVGLQMSARSA